MRAERPRTIANWLAQERDDAVRAVVLIWLASALLCAATSSVIAGRPLAPGELGVRLLAAAMAPVIVAAPFAMVLAAAAARALSIEEDILLLIVAAGSAIGGIGYWILLLWLSERAAAWRTHRALLLLAVSALSSAVLLPVLATWAAAI
jgi:hypothetical protein